MGTRKTHDLTVVVGSYVGRDSQEKKKYQNIGSVMETDTGNRFILLDRTFNPAGVPYDAARGNQILVSMFEPRQDGQTGGGSSGAGPGKPAARSDDDIPF